MKSMPLIVLALALSTPCLADTVFLTADRDNTLYDDGFGGVSNGAGSYLFLGNTSLGQYRRALVRFDVAGALPPGAVVTSARLRVAVSLAPPLVDPSPTTLHRLLEDWGEGTSNAGEPGGRGTLATTGDATWRYRFYNTVEWATEGGTFVPAASAASLLGLAGESTTYGSTPEMVADVQGWLDTPGGNYGWILRGDEDFFTTARRINSRENAAPETRPILEITFDPPSACSPCVADFNNSGGTPDDADVTAFFAAWNAGDECADANGSGGTPDDADVTTFFNLWNAGGC